MSKPAAAVDVTKTLITVRERALNNGPNNTRPSLASQESPEPHIAASIKNSRPDAKGRPLTLAEQIAEEISQEILLEKYDGDQKLIEQNISEAFQVSRGPVRDAFRILESNGLVKILPRRGTRVTKLTVEEIERIYDIRAVLLALATRRFVERGVHRDVLELEGLVRRLAEFMPHDDLRHKYASTSHQASMLIASRCGNPRLAEIIGSLAPQTIRYTKLAIVSRKRREQSVKSWQNLLQVVKRGNADKAAAAAKGLVDDARRAARSVIEERLKQSAGDWDQHPRTVRRFPV